MSRTKTRPLVTGEMRCDATRACSRAVETLLAFIPLTHSPFTPPHSPFHAFALASGCGIVGVSLLAATVNPLVAALGAGNIALYAGVYTPMKRSSIYNTVSLVRRGQERSGCCSAFSRRTLAASTHAVSPPIPPPVGRLCCRRHPAADGLGRRHRGAGPRVLCPGRRPLCVAGAIETRHDDAFFSRSALVHHGAHAAPAAPRSSRTLTPSAGSCSPTTARCDPLQLRVLQALLPPLTSSAFRFASRLATA